MPGPELVDGRLVVAAVHAAGRVDPRQQGGVATAEGGVAQADQLGQARAGLLPEADRVGDPAAATGGAASGALCRRARRLSRPAGHHRGDAGGEQHGQHHTDEDESGGGVATLR
jgi:hypothetical protein